jgi:hypothetical protein
VSKNRPVPFCGQEWNKTEASVLAFMFETLCQSKFSLTSFLALPRVTFNFARTGYDEILHAVKVLEDFTSKLYREKITPYLKTVANLKLTIANILGDDGET